MSRRSAELLARRGHVLLRSLLREPELTLFRRYVLARAQSGALDGDGQVVDTPSAYGDFFIDGLLADLLPAIERASGRALFPTYSYFRVYKRGDVLEPHRDRPACEISVTLTLGYEARRPWPLWIESPSGPTSVTIAPGDALLYRGIDHPHWRTAFAGRYSAQAFLHYVDREGPNAGWRYDKRRSLAAVAVRKRRRR